MKVTLYQYLTCPFCCKTRAFLEYYGIDFQVVEVNPLSRSEIGWSDYKKVPIVIVELDGKDDKQQLNDSSVIISILKTFMVNTHKDLDKIVSYYPLMVTQDANGKEVREIANKHWVMVDLETMSEEYGKRRRAEVKWRKWVDDHFVHMLAPNIYRSQAEALQAFDYITNVQNFGPWEKWAAKYGGSAIMWTIAKRLKSKYQLKDDVRESLYDAANEWLKGVGKKKFMGGSQPNLADLAVYGVLSSIEDFDTFRDLMENTKMRPWYERTKKAVKTHAGANTTHTNDNRKAAGYAPGAGVSSRRSGQSRVWTSAALKALAVGNFALIFCLTGAAIFLALEVSDLQRSDQKAAYELSGLRLSLIKRYHELSDLKLAFHLLDRKTAEFQENIAGWMQQTETVPARLVKTEEALCDAAASVAQRNDSGLEEETLQDDMMNPQDKPEEGNATTPLALPKAFYEAAKTCQADGGTLAMPRDAEIDAFLISLKNNATQDQGAWFGLHDEGKGGKSARTLGFTNDVRSNDTRLGCRKERVSSFRTIIK
uniref:GST C-terminal domain-containing protein n=1 Tax=Branchiostoma floridae TaxID=7739 RepID=C3YTK0_BRAFL|eukprot:XP_002600115.1 hypothetical protein BRAFLDRAFT_66624 [Branchiostoma floridae]